MGEINKSNKNLLLVKIENMKCIMTETGISVPYSVSFKSEQNTILNRGTFSMEIPFEQCSVDKLNTLVIRKAKETIKSLLPEVKKINQVIVLSVFGTTNQHD